VPRSRRVGVGPAAEEANARSAWPRAPCRTVWTEASHICPLVGTRWAPHRTSAHHLLCPVPVGIYSAAHEQGPSAPRRAVACQLPSFTAGCAYGRPPSGRPRAQRAEPHAAKRFERCYTATAAVWQHVSGEHVVRRQRAPANAAAALRPRRSRSRAARRWDEDDAGSVG
jgi:hypothetical protein